MLQHIAWVHPGQDLRVEFQQCQDEGRDVAQFLPLLDAISAMQPGTEQDALAKTLLAQMHQVPCNPTQDAQEPSTLDAIRALRPTNTPPLPTPDLTTLSDRVLGAWQGRVAGCLLGKPVEGYLRAQIEAVCRHTGNFPLTQYLARDPADPCAETRCWIDHVNGCAPIDDDTNYTVLGMKIVEDYGHDFTACDVGEAWLKYLPYLAVCTAERVAYRNLCNGLLPPYSATDHNPYREYIGAQIRADFFGYIHPGDPAAAAAMAFQDACISHVKNGIYGEMLIAAMLAAAAVTQDITQVILAGLGQIPAACRLAKALREAMHWHATGVSCQEAFHRLSTQWDESLPLHWCHTISNAVIVVLALLYGAKDFSRSLCLAVEVGFDTDCNGATVGSILGMMLGTSAIDPAWTAPFADKLQTSIVGYERVTLSDMAQRTIALIK